MSSTEASSNTEKKEESQLEDLVSQLRHAINKSGWLTQNTSAQWEAENPELAKQWRQAMESTNQSSTNN